MKKIFFLLFCVLSIATVTNAQDSTAKKVKKDHIQDMDSTHKQKMKDKGFTKENMKDLDLTADQQKQMETIHTDAKKQKDAIKNDASLTEDQKQEKMKAIDKDSKTKISGLLTPAQKEKWKARKQKPAGQ